MTSFSDHASGPGDPERCKAADGPVVVAVPARDEAAGIARTVQALCAQLGGQGQPLTDLRVLIVANNCRDDTARRARAAALPGTVVEVIETELSADQAHVGGARRLALNLAAERAGSSGILVSTDADTVPEQDWLWQLCAPVRAGADAAAGRILLSARTRAALPDAVRRTYLLDTAYRLAAEALTDRLNPSAHDPWPRHHQHFGANLALSVAAYRAVGGVPPVSSLEDVALVHALQRRDLTLRHTPHARVWTSARMDGRVTLGFSTQLQEWQSGPEHWTVPGGPELAALARAEAAFSRIWKGAAWQGQVERVDLARLWLTPPDHLGAALGAPTLGLGLEAAHAACWAYKEWSSRFPAVPVRRAWAQVRAFLADNEARGEPAADLATAADD